MIARAKTALATQTIPIELIEGDISAQPIQQASIVVLNFTLQFIPIAERLSLLQKIHQGLQSGGILIMSEKIAGNNPAENAELTALHHAYKRENAYSELEISQKRTALEHVMIPETCQTHEDRLIAAGLTTWAEQIPAQLKNQPTHGKQADWQAAIANLPQIATETLNINQGTLQIDTKQGRTIAEREQLRSALQALHPWRKRPYLIHGVKINTEWRSDRNMATPDWLSQCKNNRLDTNHNPRTTPHRLDAL